ncbi:LOW QUALITY PROTEIN: olfactory receptor 52J3 [Coregonus clupeaformis]|uniref:LOW QUALITY PROTEIN: olfactory receptor 52J3 n=1 Tax=Coregonus clupeaformis TaxID=59861 RepID=UPI001E1C5583|nr:LOW QUALITY PROTEIN: olfactory receptor 52J3 [Coregonus clupeaformis]
MDSAVFYSIAPAPLPEWIQQYSTVLPPPLYLNGFSSLLQYRPPPFALHPLILVITKQHTLLCYAPMYDFTGAISALGIAVPVMSVPRMLISFLSDINLISREERLIQMFCIHYCACFQSTILLGMAIGRYVAICLPLRYNDYINMAHSLIFNAVLVIRNTTVMVGLVTPLTLCKSNMMYHCFCERTSVVSLACGNVSRNNMAGIVTFCIPTTYCIFIVYSYVVIFMAILKSPSGDSRHKAIDTCSSHVMVICVANLSAMTAFVGYRVNTIPPDVRVFTSLMYILVPGCFNPVISGYRTKEIRVHLLKYFTCNKMDLC